MNAQELRTSGVDRERAASVPRNPVTIILDGVLDTYNVGAVFRLADAVAAERVYLCGATPTPPNSKIKKASVNTWEWVDWQYAPSGPAAIARFRAEHPDGTVICVEQTAGSVAYTEATYPFPVAIVVGNESTGVTPETIAAADLTVELPMWGVNTSLNVMASLAIVLYAVMGKRSGRREA